MPSPITPYDFGAVGYKPTTPYNPADSRPTAGIPDDKVALQAWAAAASASTAAGSTFEATGLFGTSEPIVIGPAAPYTAPRALGGDLMLVSLAPMAKLLTMRNVDGWTWNGTLDLVGGGSGKSWASRDVQTGLALEGTYTRLTITGAVRAYGFQFAGVPIVTGGGGTAEYGEWLSVGGGIHGWDIGSAPVLSAPECALSSAYSNPVNEGASGSIGQRTILNVAVMPPAFIDGYGDLKSQCVAVKIGNRPYVVTDMNRTNGTLKIYPWLEASADLSKPLQYIFGGVFMEGGPDGTLANMPELNGTRSNVWNCMSPHISSIGHLTSQFGGADILMGSPEIAQFGGEMGGFYSEGGNTTSAFELVMFNGNNNRVKFGNLSMADLSKWWTPYAWNGIADLPAPGFQLATLDSGFWEKNPFGKGINGAYQGEGISIQANKPTAVFDPVNNFTLTLAPYDVNQDRLFGVRSRRVIIAGTGSNGEPTGTVTVATEGPETVNGANSVTYSALKTPLHLVVTADPATGNFTCKRLGTVPAAAMADLGAAPTQADFNALLAKLRANGTLAA